MSAELPEYDPRYLAGVLLFNRGDYFEAHEVWEELWGDTPGLERSFFQGLIQAAVGLCHFCNGNVRGAVKLFHTGRAYMEQFSSPCRGLDIADFWQQMEQCFAPLLEQHGPPTRVEPNEALLPTIVLNPEPGTWPDPEAFLERDEHS